MAIRDGDWELFDYDFQTGRTVWHQFDGRQNHWRIDYPVESVLKDNTAERNAHTNARWGDGRRVASIPLNIYYEQLAEASEQDDQRYIRRWLNDRDNRDWRTFEGKI